MKHAESNRRGGFTLIELLVVVAIISILAALAVPNYLTAQMRARVAATEAELRTLATAIEAYQVEQQAYPPSRIPFYSPGAMAETWRLSTPIAYLTQVPLDTFVNAPSASLGGIFGLAAPYLHYLADPALGEAWVAFSYGTDHDFEPSEIHYDPSNGATSSGDIFWAGFPQ